MVMEKARPRLETLAQLGPQLNKATSLYMAELIEIEDELSKLKLGVAVELPKWLQTDNPKADYNDEGESLGVFYTAWTLGYGKSDQGKWCFLVRQYKVPVTPSGTYPEPGEMVEEEATPLLNASRDLRIAAADTIPDLLQEVEKKAKAKIESLRKVTDRR